MMNHYLAIVLLGACFEADEVECPQERYMPSGPTVEDPDECPTGTCVWYCAEFTCGGVFASFSCEPCDRVDEYVQGQCARCIDHSVDGITWVGCEGESK